MEPITLTLCLLVFAIVMFVWEKVPLAVTSMIVCVALVITGVLNIKQAFAGFIDTNVILFVAMFIVGGALFETGMANKVGGVITRFAKTEKQLIFTIMVVVGLMSGVLSNTGTAAVLIPVVIGVAAKSGFSRSRLLMPLVFAAALGGNLSLIGAPGNLIAQSALQNIGGGFGFFEYAKIGLPMLICGILYFLTIGYRFLPNNATGGGGGGGGGGRGMLCRCFFFQYDILCRIRRYWRSAMDLRHATSHAKPAGNQQNGDQRQRGDSVSSIRVVKRHENQHA
ncbi:cation transporter [Salmonella enterica subsp. enterica serovar Bovismorbificans]|nr:cation transporter [Salmonella enterica subsp. enterica serovar Bovismorbificans]